MCSSDKCCPIRSCPDWAQEKNILFFIHQHPPWRNANLTLTSKLHLRMNKTIVEFTSCFYLHSLHPFPIALCLELYTWHNSSFSYIHHSIKNFKKKSLQLLVHPDHHPSLNFSPLIPRRVVMSPHSPQSPSFSQGSSVMSRHSPQWLGGSPRCSRWWKEASRPLLAQLDRRPPTPQQKWLWFGFFEK